MKDRVYAVGRESYIRAYPNPGIGVCLYWFRIAISLYGGIEIFRPHPKRVWIRRWSLFSRIERPRDK